MSQTSSGSLVSDGERVRAIYQQTEALRRAGPILERLNAAVRARHDRASPDGSISQAELDWLAHNLLLAPGRRLLDLACGSGVPACILARSGCEVIGLDLVADRVQTAQARAFTSGLGERVHFYTRDANLGLAYPDGSFDAVTLLDALVHFSRQDRLLAEIFRVLSPGGRLALCTVLGGEPSAGQAVMLAETPGTIFRLDLPALQSLVRRSGFQEIARRDRTPAVLVWHSHRLQVFQEHAQELEHELGPVESNRLLSRSEAVIQLLESSVWSSFLLVLQKPEE